MIVYHGTTEKILYPDVNHSKKYLDFGRGFYVTTYREQAEKWAKRKAVRSGKIPIVNSYEMPESLKNIRSLKFHNADGEWLDFVCSCRKGERLYKDYDVIIGNVANDDVFKTVDMYFRGIWSRKKALEELRYYKKNDQICFVSQEALKQLVFIEAYEVGMKYDRQETT